MNPYRLMAQIAVPDADKISVDESTLLSTAEAKKEYTFELSTAKAVLIAFAMAFYITIIVLLYGLAALAAALLICMTAIAFIMIITDIKCLIIPWELSVALLPIALLWQYIQFGLQELFVAICMGIGAWLLFFLSDKLFAIIGRSASVGGGDRRMIAPIFIACGFPNCLYATLAVCIGTLLVIAVLHLTTKYRIEGMDTTLPFGPSLAAILLLGLVI